MHIFVMFNLVDYINLIKFTSFIRNGNKKNNKGYAKRHSDQMYELLNFFLILSLNYQINLKCFAATE